MTVPSHARPVVDTGGGPVLRAARPGGPSDASTNPASSVPRTHLAARLENSGEPGMIHVSPEVRAALAATYDFQSRGAIDIKGVGAVETSFLLGPRGRNVATAVA